MLLDDFLFPLAYLEYFLLYLIFFHDGLFHFCTDLHLLPRALSLDVNSHLLCPVTHRAEWIFDLGLSRVAKPERPNQSVAGAKL